MPESLALHLLKDGIPAWPHVKDLNPGVFWERDLFAALDKACCVVIIASADSMKSPNVRQEMDRAISQKKRIIIARFRGAKLADELCQCEVVDFRGAFRPALAQPVFERLRVKSACTKTSATSRAPDSASAFYRSGIASIRLCFPCSCRFLWRIGSGATVFGHGATSNFLW